MGNLNIFNRKKNKNKMSLKATMDPSDQDVNMDAEFGENVNGKTGVSVKLAGSSCIFRDLEGWLLNEAAFKKQAYLK